jgi:hypothetical protein
MKFVIGLDQFYFYLVTFSYLIFLKVDFRGFEVVYPEIVTVWRIFRAFLSCQST